MPPPPPRNIEELLYRMLMESKMFHRMVRRVYCKVNGIPFHQHGHPDSPKTMSKTNYALYHPTTLHKFKAFKVLFADELKRSFGFKK